MFIFKYNHILILLSIYLCRNEINFANFIARTKSSASETLAPPAVACDIFSFRRSAHPPGGFLLYGSEVSYRVKNRSRYIPASVFISPLFYFFLLCKLCHQFILSIKDSGYTESLLNRVCIF